jgi:hypothetical protein
MATCQDDEGWQIVSHQRVFDVTPCFEEGVIIPALLIIFLISAIWRISFLRSMNPRSRTMQSLRILRVKSVSFYNSYGTATLFHTSWRSSRADCLRQTLLAIAFLASTTSLIHLLYTREPVPVRQTYLLEPVALGVSLILTVLNHSRTRTSSSVLLVFWPLYTLGYLLWVRTIISKESWHIRSVLVLKTLVVLFGLSSFGLEFLAPKDSDEGDSEGKVIHENPLTTANLFDCLTFGWMTPLMRKGAAQYITEHDLPPLLSRDDSASLGRDLQLALMKQCVLALFLEACFNILCAVHLYGRRCLSRMGYLLWWLLDSRSFKMGLLSFSHSCYDGYFHIYRLTRVLVRTRTSHQA